MRRLWHFLALGLLALLLGTSAPALASAAPGLAPAAAAPQTRRLPIILIPGIAGSELYNQNELLWLDPVRLLGSQVPILNLFQMNWLMPLRLSSDGITPYKPSYRIRVGDLMRHTLTDAYSGMITALKNQGYVEGVDLRLFPYDWRQSPTLATEQLGALVDRTLRETGAGQVVLIGHSQGGLIARDYVVRGGASRVRATISLATPWLGAPLAYQALEYGWDLGLKLPGTSWSVLAPRDVRLLVQNYPSVYAMAPGRRYWDWYDEGYLTRSGRSLAYGESLEKAIAPHNRALASQGAAFQDRLLDGEDHGVLQFVLAGRGRRTLGGIAERKDWLGVTHKTESYLDGDEVVPVHSADLGYSKDPAQVERYIGKVAGVAYANHTHTFFAQSVAVQETVVRWLDLIQAEQNPQAR